VHGRLERKIDEVQIALERQFSRSEEPLNERFARLERLEKRISEVAGQMEMTQLVIGTDRLDRLEATVQTLLDKVSQIWDFVVPYQPVIHNAVPGPKRATLAPAALSIRTPV
jgi:chromosome segregation ATPase